ncbi:MAG: riboflavin biosynthesis protein RibF [Ferrimicrobium sp.]
MKVIFERDSSTLPFEESVVTVGSFDGVHLGHAKLIAIAHAEALELGLPLVAVSFDQHPVRVIAPERAPQLLVTKDGQAAAMATLGVDVLYLLHFDLERSHEEPEAFVNDTLAAGLGARVVVVGENFHFGARGSGDVATLRRMAPVSGFSLHAVPLLPAYSVDPDLFPDRELAVSATVIRSLLQQGDSERARVLLGRPFGVHGRVEHGDSRGRLLGYPTANVVIPAELVRPADGVYAGFVRFGGIQFVAAISLGTRPMYYPQGGDRLLEAFLLGFEGDLYGREVEVTFLRRVREQRVFDGERALRAQMALDVAEIEAIGRHYAAGSLVNE